MAEQRNIFHISLSMAVLLPGISLLLSTVKYTQLGLLLLL